MKEIKEKRVMSEARPEARPMSIIDLYNLETYGKATPSKREVMEYQEKYWQAERIRNMPHAKPRGRGNVHSAIEAAECDLISKANKRPSPDMDGMPPAPLAHSEFMTYSGQVTCITAPPKVSRCDLIAWMCFDLLRRDKKVIISIGGGDSHISKLFQKMIFRSDYLIPPQELNTPSEIFDFCRRVLRGGDYLRSHRHLLGLHERGQRDPVQESKLEKLRQIKRTASRAAESDATLLVHADEHFSEADADQLRVELGAQTAVVFNPKAEASWPIPSTGLRAWTDLPSAQTVALG